jgi:hypothetical protein
MGQISLELVLQFGPNFTPEVPHGVNAASHVAIVTAIGRRKEEFVQYVYLPH